MSVVASPLSDLSNGLAQLEGTMTVLAIEEQEIATIKKYDDYVQLIRNRILVNKHNGKKIPAKLFESILELIWDVDLLGAEPSYIRRVLSQLKYQFDNETATNDLNVQPSDCQDLLEHKPTEIISDKCCQIILHLCLGDVDNSVKQLQTLKGFMSHPAILRHAENENGYIFLAKSIELFVYKISGIGDKLMIFGDPKLSDEENSKIPSFEDLSTKSQVAVMVAKCYFVRNFRHKVTERLDLLKEVIILDSTNYEWYLARSEMWRRKRRDSSFSRGKRPVKEEFDLVAEARILEPQNPFVRLALMDCIIDCIRDSRGYFTCGDMKFDTADLAMEFMKDTCRDLLYDYPNSIRILSQISDYFCRFVAFRYFDVQFAEDCLQRAYELNPKNPKSTHRFGIFARMSKGDMSTSFNWFKTTVELDPLHFNSFMECVKNMIAKLNDYDVIKYMDDKLKSPEFASWTELEILEFLFYKGLAHFIKGETEKTLETWDIVCKGNQSIFCLTDLDRTMGFYEWDENLISTDKLRLWMKQEKENLDVQKYKTGDSSEIIPNEYRKKNVNLMFSLMVGIKSPTRAPLSDGLFKQCTSYGLLMGTSKGSRGTGDQ